MRPLNLDVPKTASESPPSSFASKHYPQMRVSHVCRISCNLQCKCGKGGNTGLCCGWSSCWCQRSIWSTDWSCALCCRGGCIPHDAKEPGWWIIKCAKPETLGRSLVGTVCLHRNEQVGLSRMRKSCTDNKQQSLSPGRRTQLSPFCCSGPHSKKQQETKETVT